MDLFKLASLAVNPPGWQAYLSNVKTQVWHSLLYAGCESSRNSTFMTTVGKSYKIATPTRPTKSSICRFSC